RTSPVAAEGLIYAGAQREPDDSGRLFGIHDQSGTTMWDAADLLDATPAAARHIYTVSKDGERLAFSAEAAADPRLQEALFAGNARAAADVVGWATAPRFGGHVLGGIQASTPAVLSAPRMPGWAGLPGTSKFEQALAGQFVAAQAGRQPLVLV